MRFAGSVFPKQNSSLGRSRAKLGEKKKRGVGGIHGLHAPNGEGCTPLQWEFHLGGFREGPAQGIPQQPDGRSSRSWGGGVCTPSLLLAARIRPPPRNGRRSPSAIYHHLRASEVCREQLLRSAERRGGTGRWGGGKGAGGCPVCAPSLGLRGRWGGIRRGYWGRGIDGVIWRRGALMGCVGKGMW